MIDNNETLIMYVPRSRKSTLRITGLTWHVRARPGNGNVMSCFVSALLRVITPDLCVCQV